MPTTLLAARRGLAYALDDLEVYNVASSTSTTVVVGRLVNVSTGASTERYNGRWVFCESGVATQQRRVRTSGYDPTTGRLTIDSVWSVNPVAVTDDVELTGLFPCFTDAPRSDTDYLTMLNRGLAHLLVEDEAALAITTSDQYSLAGLTFLDHPGRLRYVREPNPISGRTPINSDSRDWRVDVDGETPYLRCRVPFGAGVSGNITLGVRRPADTWVKRVTTGVWATSVLGFTNDADEVVPDLDSIIKAALVEAYRALMTRNVGRPTGNWAERYEAALADAKRLRNYDDTIERAAAPAAAGEAA